MSENAIEIKGITKSYKDFKLDNLNLNLPTGTILGLVGENGAGKTTTIKLIMGAISAESGSVSVLGNDNANKTFIDTKQDIGVVLDEANFPAVLNIKNIDKIMSKTYKNWDSKEFFEYIQRFDLPQNKKFKEFSKGMKMKLSIAVALSHKAKLLILDEATGGLDPMARDEILDILNEFTRDENNSILFSSHITSDLEKICDYIAFIHKGKLILCEEKDRLIESYAIAKLSNEEFLDIPTDAIVGKKKNSYGYEVLLKKDEINTAIELERTTIEDIVLFMVKGWFYEWINFKRYVCVS